MPIINTQEGILNLIKRYVTPYGYNGVTIQPATTYHVGGGNPPVSQFFAFLGDSQESYTVNTLNNHGQYAAAMFFIHSYQDSSPAYNASYSNDMVLIFASNSTDVFPDDISVSFIEYPGDHRTHITTFTNRSNKTITMRAMTARAGRYSGPGGSDYKMGYSYGLSDRTLQPGEEVGWFTLDTVCFAFSTYSEYPIIYIQPRENFPKTTKDANFIAFMRDLGAAIKNRAGMPPINTNHEMIQYIESKIAGHAYGGGDLIVNGDPAMFPASGHAEENSSFYSMYGTPGSRTNYGQYSCVFLLVHFHSDPVSDFSESNDAMFVFSCSTGNLYASDFSVRVGPYNESLQKVLYVTNNSGKTVGVEPTWSRSYTYRGQLYYKYNIGVGQGYSQILYAGESMPKQQVYNLLDDDFVLFDNAPVLAAQQYASTIRSLDGETVFPSVVIPTINSNLGDYLTDIANAIRDKKGITPHEGNEINAQDFASEIASIPVPEGGDS